MDYFGLLFSRLCTILCSENFDIKSASASALGILLEIIPNDYSLNCQDYMERLLGNLLYDNPLKMTYEFDFFTAKNNFCKESTLLAISSFTSENEICRKIVIDNRNNVSEILACLRNKHVFVRVAASQCCRSLSRSIKNLRTTLVDAGILPIVITLLDDESVLVQAAACAIICNMVLEFSALKEACLCDDVIEKLVFFLDSKETCLRLNSLWAIKNLLYQAEERIAMKVLRVLTFERLFTYFTHLLLGL